jgi:hypothetical protein
MLFAYTAEAGTPSEDGLKLLASWARPSRLRPPGIGDKSVGLRHFDG